jgi:hypothetical protein
MVQAQILSDHEFHGMPKEAYQNATQPAVPPVLVTCNPNALIAGRWLERPVRYPVNLSYYRTPLASTVIASAKVERGR